MLLMIFSAFVGFILGIMYFYGAYHTALNLSKQESPTAVLAGSFIARTFLVAIIFYLIGGSNAIRLIVMLASFILGRIVFMKKIMKKFNNSSETIKEVKVRKKEKVLEEVDKDR